MTEKNKFLTYALEHQFPHPIAAPFRNAQTAQLGVDRAANYLSTIDGILRYAGALLLSDFFAKGPSDEMVAGVTRVLLHPTFSKWADLIVEIARQLQGKKPFIPELIEALVSDAGEQTDCAELLVETARMAEELLDRKDDLLDEDKASIVAGKLSTRINSLMQFFTFLEQYPLVVFRGHTSSPEGGFRGFMLRWMGYRALPLPVSVEFEGSVPEGSPLVVTPDATQGLELAPFISIDIMPGKDDEGLFLVSGLRSEEQLRKENYSSGRFLTMQLETNGEPQNLRSFMEGWSSGGKIAAMSPAQTSNRWLQFKSRLLPAEKILEDRYKSLGFIGRGGIGAVYRVFDLEEGIEKAVKVLYPDLSRNEFFTRYFLETGTALSKLQNTNLATVYEADYSSTLQENHIIMSYMRGGSLEEALARRETMGPKAALLIAVGILSGLEALHGANLLHGGIHPGNILFDESGNACLADFGILRLPSSRVTPFRPLERVHSLRYAAPELLLGGQASGASDLYSTALVLYEILTGIIPSKTEFIPPSELIFPIPESLDDLLQKALASKPAGRFSDATEFRIALQQLLASMGPEYEVSVTAQAQQLIGHLSDVLIGHTEQLDLDRAERMASNDYEGAARLLQLKVDELWDIDERVYWMQELAVLYFEKLDMPGKAVSLYRDSLELAPDNPVAVKAILDHFSRTENWEEMAGVLEDLLEQAEGPLTPSHLDNLVDLYRNRLGQPAQAADYLEKLIEMLDVSGEPDFQHYELLVQLRERERDWERAAATLEKWALQPGSKDNTTSIFKRLGQIQHQQMEDYEAAIITYEQLLSDGNADAEVMNGLRNLYRLSFSFARLDGLLSKMIESGFYEDEQLFELYQEQGEVLSSYLYKSKEAVAVWNELLTRNPGNQTALSYLERIYLREGRYDAYLEVLQQKALLAVSEEERASILLSAALAQLEYQSNAEGALLLLEEAYGLAPQHRGVETALERIYEQNKGPAEPYSQLLLARLERESKASVRLGLLWKLAGLFTGTDDAAALEVLKRAFAEAPTDPAIRQEVERLAESLEDYEELVAFYMERLAESEGEVKRYLAGRIAYLCVEKVTDPDKSAYALETAAELAPDSTALSKALLSRFRNAERWPELSRMLLVQLVDASDERYLELFEEIALLVKNRMEKSNASQEILSKLSEYVPTLPAEGPLKSFLDACRATEQWTLLATVVESQLEKEEDPIRAQEMRVELGGALMQLGNLEKAREWLEKALDKAPRDAVIQNALEDTIAAGEDWSSLVEFYKRLIPIVEDLDRKREFMEKAAEIEVSIFERLDSAIDLYRQLTALQPDNPAHARSLADTLRKAGRWTELTWHMEQMTNSASKEDKTGLLSEMAEIYYSELKNPDAAIQTLRQLIKLVPDSEDVLVRIRKICMNEKRYETLLRLLSERAKEQTGDKKLATKVEMAHLSAMEMGLIPPAKTYLQDVLMEAPDNIEAFDLLHEILVRQEDWKSLAELLATQVETTAQDQRRIVLGMELALLQVEKLDRKVAAAEVLERIWELDPDNVEVALLLARTYAQLSRWDKTASMLSVLQSFTGSLDEDQQTETIYLSAVTFEALLQRGQAISYYRKILALNYRTQEAQEKLATLLYMEEDYEEARKFIQALTESGNLTTDKAREFQTLRADIDRKLGRRDRSREHLDALLEQTPGDPAVLRKLVDLCREEEDVKGEASYLDRLLQVESDPESRFALLVRLGNLRKDLPDGLEDAAKAMQKAFDLKPESKVVAVTLGDIYTRLQDWEAASRYLTEAEKLETETGRKAAFALTQGILFQDHAGDTDAAVQHLDRCLRHDPAKWEAFRRIESIAVEQGNWTMQKELYENILERLGSGSSPELRHKLNFNLGRILLEKFGDSKAALEHIEEAIRINPDDQKAQQLAAGIHLQTTDGAERALQAYKKLVAANPSDIMHLQMLRRTYAMLKRYDEAWYIAGVLVLLGAASEKERAFYKKFSSNALKIKPQALDLNRLRSDLMASDEDWQLTEIIRILTERMAPRLKLPTPKSLNLSRKTAFDENQSQLFAKLTATVAKVLGITKPATHLRETSGWLLKEACFPPVMVMSPDLLQHRSGKDLRFELAHTMALFLPHHLAAGLLDKDTIRHLMGNVLKLIMSTFPEPAGDARANADLRKQMEKAIPAVELGTIRELVGKLREQGGELSVKRWLIGVDKTTARFGLLFANDIQVAAEMVRKCPVHLSVASRDELVNDLVAYTVSDEFIKVRKYLGISVF